MSYHVHIESFEGPFDLLLYLVNRQKVQIQALSISQIADQYLDELTRMGSLDLDVASDFLVVAATLLELKAASLLPTDEAPLSEDEEELDPYALRDALVEQLIAYKKFKNAASALRVRQEAEERIHVRPFGPDRSQLHLMPDYLKGVSMDKLATLCANCFARRDVFLLESEHIASRVIPLEEQVARIKQKVSVGKPVTFRELVSPDGQPADAKMIVVTFLAVLELFKRAEISVEQDVLFGEIIVGPHEASSSQGRMKNEVESA